MDSTYAKTSAALLLLSLLIGGCQPILLKMYGIKDPKIESRESILRSALKYDLDTSNIATVNSSDFLAVLSKQGIPEGAIFDRYGKYIEYKDSDTACNAGLFQFIPALNMNVQYNQPEHPSLNEELSKLRDLNGNPLKPLEPADFYLFIYWTTWTGKLNEDHVKIWEDLAYQNKNSKIEVLKVNLDMQSHWSQDEQTRIEQVMNKKKSK